MGCLGSSSLKETNPLSKEQLLAKVLKNAEDYNELHNNFYENSGYFRFRLKKVLPSNSGEMCKSLFEAFNNLFRKLENVRRILFDKRIALCYKSGGSALKSLPDIFAIYRSKTSKDNETYLDIDFWSLFNSFLSIMYNLSIHSKGHVEIYKIKFQDNSLSVLNPPEVLKEAIQRFNEIWKDSDTLVPGYIDFLWTMRGGILSDHEFTIQQMKTVQQTFLREIRSVDPFNYVLQSKIAEMYPPIFKWYFGKYGFPFQYGENLNKIFMDKCNELIEDKKRIIYCLSNQEFIQEVNEKYTILLNRKKEPEASNANIGETKGANEVGEKKEEKLANEINSEVINAEDGKDPLEKIIENPFRVCFEICYEDEAKQIMRETKKKKENELQELNELNSKPNSINQQELQKLSEKERQLMISFLEREEQLKKKEREEKIKKLQLELQEMPDLLDKFNKKLVYEFRLKLSTLFGEYAMKEYDIEKDLEVEPKYYHCYYEY